MKKKRKRRFKKFDLIITPLVVGLLTVGILTSNNLAAESSRQTTSLSPSPVANVADFHISIPSLEIDAPIIANVDGNSKEMYISALEKGVAQLRGSAKPGEGSNIFLFGHSSYYWWAPGQYKTVFAKLPNIKNGSEIIIHYNAKDYKYKVTGTKTVSPGDINVTSKTSFEQLSLMTCVPVGTNQNRLIVVAKPE